ncbi:hypothetical protein CA265_04910 [Sphingobacteriaceae bacterium GW460-11-11-14-LB5]|nr:hypothetical protein CA265_04910 [Sphingobacteriaceae bacterium GW460-11-11-14-LB5]
MESNQKLINPLDKIALSLSGGGYRAASFHLGTMAYLNRLIYDKNPLLQNLRMISTVSGGTITGVVYVLMRKQKVSFEKIYELLLQQLESLDLVRTGITQLNPDAVWKNPGKTKNLINAFAEQYKKHFTGNAVMAELQILPDKLEQVVFNSTEFSNAINFRFKNISLSLTSYAGNFYNRIYGPELDEVSMADIIAASSCFPGGFEPMLWPDDFIHDQSPNLSALKASNLVKQQPPMGVMDGGIFDNQGIDSILSYSKDPYFDLIIISDVASPDMQAFKPFIPGPKEGIKAYTYSQLKTTAQRIDQRINTILSLCLLLFPSLPLFWHYEHNIATGIFLGLSGVTMTLMISKNYLLRQFQKGRSWLAAKLLALIPKFYQEKLSALDIDQLSLHRLEPLIMDRANSLITLLIEVFLKIVRRLNYNTLYEDERYKFKRIDNRIKELTEADFKKRQKGDYDTLIGKNIKKVAEEAATCGTSLWFTDTQVLDQTLRKLIASGEFTMCFNMKIYLEKIMTDSCSGYAEMDTTNKTLIDEVYAQCIADFDRFRKDPYFMYDEMAAKPAVAKR